MSCADELVKFYFRDSAEIQRFVVSLDTMSQLIRLLDPETGAQAVFLS